jgi:hypothetical protein
MLRHPRPCCCKHYLDGNRDTQFSHVPRLHAVLAASAGTAAATVGPAACTAGRPEQLQICLQHAAGVQQNIQTSHIYKPRPHSNRVLCRATTAATAGSAQDSTAALSQSQAAVQQLVAARGLDLDPALVAQEAHLAFDYLSMQQGALPEQMQDAVQLADHALHLTDLMATGSTFMTLQMLKRHPALLQLPTYEVSLQEAVGQGVCSRPCGCSSGAHLALMPTGSNVYTITSFEASRGYYIAANVSVVLVCQGNILLAWLLLARLAARDRCMAGKQLPSIVWTLNRR